jgi:uncharacterized protein (TIGR02145 family)
MKNIVILVIVLYCLGFTQQQGSFTDSRDGKKYKTVVIGSQVWMAENSNYNANGSVCYDNKPANCNKYGRLYNWKTAMEVCPKGWHLPSEDEWEKLVDFAGGGKIAGKRLKAESSWNRNGGNDSYGFSALPGGFRNTDGHFDHADDYGYWWSASEIEINVNIAYRRHMHYSIDGAYGVYDDKSNGFSVRCVQD